MAIRIFPKYKAGERVGTTLDVTTGCFFGVTQGGGTDGGRGKRPVRDSFAGGLDCPEASLKIFCFRRAPVVAGPGFSFMRKIFFGPTATKTATRPK